MHVGFRKVEKIAKEKDCSIVGEWVKSMVNHQYWSAVSTPDGNDELIRMKWLSLANHVQKEHTGHDPLFPKCKHKRLYKRKWLKPHESD